MTKQDVIEGYLIRSPKAVVGMLYDTITRYEARIAELTKPKTCDGCKWLFYDSDMVIWCRLMEMYSERCSRQYDIDLFEPKDEKDKVESSNNE